MQLFGVCNASPDSLHTDSIVRTADEAARRVETLLEAGVFGFDVGGQGSTYAAGETTVDEEWARLAAVLPTIVATGLPVSVDTWRPETARRALAEGVTWLNAADGLQQPEMLEVVAEHRCPTVLPFLSGPDPLRLAEVTEADPVAVMLTFFAERLAAAESHGVRDLMVLDPGTGFAPHDLPWERRREYQMTVYTQLDRLAALGLPTYVALPWKRTDDHDRLLEVIVDADPDYGRSHDPVRVHEVMAARRP